MPDFPKPRWLRFSIRTLLVASTIFCVWLGYEANLAYRRLQARNRLEISGATVLVLDNDQFDHMVSVVATWRETHPDEAIIDGAYTKLGDGAYRISWIRRLLGDRSIDTVYFERPLSASDWDTMELFPEADIGAPNARSDPKSKKRLEAQITND